MYTGRIAWDYRTHRHNEYTPLHRMKTLLTKKELAERLRVHPCTIDNHVKAGTIHPRRLSPRKYLYVWEEVARDFGLN